MSALIVLLIFSLLVFGMCSYSGITVILVDLNRYRPPFRELSPYLVGMWIASLLVSIALLETIIRIL